MSENKQPASASSTLVVDNNSNSLLPEFVSEGLATVTTVFRTTRKVAEGVERVVDGVDELATLALSQQKFRLEREIRRAQLEAPVA